MKTESYGAALVQAAEACWRSIQKEHTEVRDCVVTVGTGGRRSKTLFGHFYPDKWLNEEDGVILDEVLLVAENLKRSPEEVFTTILHEATHSLAKARGIKDVSGRRHNRKFAKLALEMGLEPPEKPDKQLGWSNCTLNTCEEIFYNSDIDYLKEVLKVYRTIDQTTKAPGPIKLECDCGYKITVGKKVAQEATIKCEDCNTQFTDSETL